jgi:hypothetical protein
VTRADVFSTLAEGLKEKRAKEWGLIDDYFPTSKFQESIDARVSEYRMLLACVDASFQLMAPSSKLTVTIKLNPLQRN